MFDKVFPDELFELIMEESVLYARKCKNNTFQLTKNELLVYLGMNIVMTYIKYPNGRMYWSSKPGLRMDLIADAMTVNRFEEIKRYVHFTSEEPDPDDIFWRIRPVISIFHAVFHANGQETEHQAVDEMIIPFKGRHRGKQYLKNKPKKWGFKV